MKQEVPLIPYSKEFHYSLQGIIPYAHYRYAVLSLTILRPFYLFFLLVAGLLITLYALHQIEIEWMLGFVGAVVFIPLSALIKARKAYKTSALLNQNVSYEISNEAIHIKSFNVDSNIKWTHFTKIHENKYFFLLYTNAQAATLLSKTIFSPSQLTELKLFLTALPVKKSLLKNEPVKSI